MAAEGNHLVAEEGPGHHLAVFINIIRKSRVGAHITRVIELLFETRQTFTPDQIN
ncbi:unnamed protein product [Brassica oleracea var. botrytis]